MVDPVRARHLDRPVGRAVIDHQPLDGVEAGDLARQLCERGGERFLLVQAGDLDDELDGLIVRICAGSENRALLDWP